MAMSASEAASPYYGGGKHAFTITVNVQGSGANWSSDMVPQVVWAYSLVEALQVATEIPLAQWFPSEEEER